MCKYIYVARNPKDVAVSFYEFMKDHGSVAGFNGPWEFFIRLFLRGKGTVRTLTAITVYLLLIL